MFLVLSYDCVLVFAGDKNYWLNYWPAVWAGVCRPGGGSDAAAQCLWTVLKDFDMICHSGGFGQHGEPSQVIYLADWIYAPPTF